MIPVINMDLSIAIERGWFFPQREKTEEAQKEKSSMRFFLFKGCETCFTHRAHKAPSNTSCSSHSLSWCFHSLESLCRVAQEKPSSSDRGWQFLFHSYLSLFPASKESKRNIIPWFSSRAVFNTPYPFLFFVFLFWLVLLLSFPPLPLLFLA